MIDVIHEREFEAFVLVIYGRPLEENQYPAGKEVVPLLLDLLWLADYFQSPPTYTHVVQMIKLRSWSFPAAQLVSLSYKYKTKVWFVGAFDRLVATDLRALTAQDLEWLDFSLYVVLARLKEAVDQHRRILAAEPPLFEADPEPEPEAESESEEPSIYDTFFGKRPVDSTNPGIPHSRDCTDHTTCAQDWYTAWWHGMGRFLQDGRTPLTYTDAMRQFEKMEFGNMNLACRIKIFESIRLEKGNNYVYAMVQETCKELMKEIKGVQLTEYEDF
ncbi:hypothetical protein DFH06DRAFT_1141232 [Mycena polygramma]|nr:hypothetical protein DFH06DRAFT_1141232 [Mycena polygramma]